jgi:hypothetical protein
MTRKRSDKPPGKVSLFLLGHRIFNTVIHRAHEFASLSSRSNDERKKKNSEFIHCFAAKKSINQLHLPHTVTMTEMLENLSQERNPRLRRVAQ